MQYRGEQPWQTNRARALRSSQTLAEDIVWNELRAQRLKRFKFKRQVPVDIYFADFLCAANKLVVEIDGATHGRPHEIESDERRDRVFEDLGYRVVRVTNTDVFENLDGVLELIVAILDGRDRTRCCPSP
jgi:very-short-patch-repair endonuclease